MLTEAKLLASKLLLVSCHCRYIEVHALCFVRAGQEPKDAFGFDMEYSFPYFIIRPFCSTSCARGTTCLSGQLQHVEVRRDLIELIRSEDVIMQEESPVTADRMIN
jgi:hypothetical protein